MKKIILLMLMFGSNTAASDTFCPDVEESDWPKKEKFKDKDFSCKSVNISDLPNSEVTEEDKSGAKKVDLNGDGICEYIIPWKSGSG
ncbi:hypothetical protein, partial [Microbulbifer rhizosphaerae]